MFIVPCTTSLIMRGDSRFNSPRGRRLATTLLFMRASKRGGIVKQDKGSREGMYPIVMKSSFNT